MATRKAPRRGPKPKVLVGQLRILLEAIEEDATMYNPRDNEMVTIMNVDKWLDLADKLNEYPNGADISVASWKYVLRYWSVNTKKKRSTEKKTMTRARNNTLTYEEANELAKLEKRFYQFMKREEAREVPDEEEVPDKGTQTEDENSPENDKYLAEMFSMFSNENEENSAPPRVSKKRNDASGPSGKPKKIKLVLDNVAGVRVLPVQRGGVGKDLTQLDSVSRELEVNISTIQNRIHVIKDMWMHRCGDN